MAKRLPGFPKSKPKKKIAVKKTRDAKVIALTEANLKNAPLLRLPAEILNIIYRLVLVKAPPPKPRRMNDHSGRVKDFLTPLRVCRQIYFEATEILYATNTFSFEDPVICSTFMKALPQVQKNKIAKIHVQFSGLGFPYFKSGLDGQTRIKDARNLKSLHASITFGNYHLHDLSGDPILGYSKIMGCPMLRVCPTIRSLTLSDLHELPLTDFKVMVHVPELIWEEKRRAAVFYERDFHLGKPGQVEKGTSRSYVAMTEACRWFEAEMKPRKAQESAPPKEEETAGEAVVSKEDPSGQNIDDAAQKEKQEIEGSASDGAGQKTVEQEGGDVDGSAPVAQEKDGNHKEDNV
ncbi:MAG: hypothetical protein Q9228_007064 [Teloschistes exilis]